MELYIVAAQTGTNKYTLRTMITNEALQFHITIFWSTYHFVPVQPEHIDGIFSLPLYDFQMLHHLQKNMSLYRRQIIEIDCYSTAFGLPPMRSPSLLASDAFRAASFASSVRFYSHMVVLQW